MAAPEVKLLSTIAGLLFTAVKVFVKKHLMLQRG